MFVPRVVPGSTWEHEEASVALLDLLIADNGLMPLFQKFGLGQADIHFIKELIFGAPAGAPDGWVWQGRGKAKAFLYEIVANKRNGVDVDKGDYFARDCTNLGFKFSFDFLRLIKCSRVMVVDGESQVCYHRKEVGP